MQMSMSTNYAIRIIVELSKDEKLSATELSIRIGIPEGNILKLMKRLRTYDLIVSKQGLQGGFMLKRSPKEITLYDIADAIEPSMKLNRCLEEDEFCSRCATETCNIRYFYKNLQDILNKEICKFSIYDLLEEKRIM